MSQRELVVLGTSSQVPTKHRNHNGYFLRWDDEGFLFDPGEGTQRQMTSFGVSASAITHVLITHFHGDHCLGLASLIQRISLDQVAHTIQVHYPASGEEYFQRLRWASIYHDQAKLLPKPIEASGVIYESDRIQLSAEQLDHTVDCFGYRIEEKDEWNLDPAKLRKLGLQGPELGRLKVSGSIEVEGVTYRLEELASRRPGQSMAFVMDTRVCEAAANLARGVDLLLCESTFLESEGREAEEYGHLTAGQAAKIASTAGVKQLALSHFSQRYRELEPFIEEAGKLHGNVLAVRDGDRIPLPRTKRAQ